jgi:hypothetical protein
MSEIRFYEKGTHLPLSYIFGESTNNHFSTGTSNIIDTNNISEGLYLLYHNGHSIKTEFLTSKEQKKRVIEFSPIFCSFFSTSSSMTESIEMRKIWKTKCLITGKYNGTSFTFFDSVKDQGYMEVEFSSKGVCSIITNNNTEIREYFPSLKNNKYFNIGWKTYYKENGFYHTECEDILEDENGLVKIGIPRWYFYQDMLLKVFSGFISNPPMNKLLIRCFE